MYVWPVFGSGFLECFLGVHGHDEVFLAAFDVVGWYAVSPPELTADAPVVDVLKPVAVCRDVLLRVELDLAFEYWGKGYVGKVLHAQIPLHTQAWLYGCVGIALAVAYLVFVVFDVIHEACFAEVFGYLFAHVVAVHANIHACGWADGAVGVEDVDGFEVVCLAEVVVVDVVGWGDFQTACAELDVYVSVFDDGDNAAYQGDNDAVSLQPLVLDVFGVDTHGCVAHDGLGACGGYDGVVAALVTVEDFAFLPCELHWVGVGIGYVVFQVIEF